MAKIYAKERAKYGNLTGQIIVWPVEVDNVITSSNTKKQLPAGYLRCDGTVYNAIDYPQLAAICGTGTGGKFVRRNLANEPMQTVSDEQFVVPDLGSKYPKATGAATGGGQYLDIRETNAADIEVSRSGIGIEAQSIGDTNGEFDIEYEGNFVIPSHDINMRGRPSWTVGTDAGRRTDSEVVDMTAIAGHMHFHSGTRTRLKAQTEVDENTPSNVLDPAPIGNVGLFQASPIPLYKWLEATMEPNSAANKWPGNNQDVCKGIASSNWQDGKQYLFGDGNWSPLDKTMYGNACWNNDQPLNQQWNYNCLLPAESYMNEKGLDVDGKTDGSRAWDNYPITQTPYTVDTTTNSKPNYESGIDLTFGLSILCVFGNSGWAFQNSTIDVAATYVQSGSGVPNDWKDSSCYDVVPLQNNTQIWNTTQLYPSLFNEFTETDTLNTTANDRTDHFHKINIDKGAHSYKLRTDATEIAADLLDTKLRLDVDNAVSVDSVCAPFIVLEYLIKI